MADYFLEVSGAGFIVGGWWRSLTKIWSLKVQTGHSKEKENASQPSYLVQFTRSREICCSSSGIHCLILSYCAGNIDFGYTIVQMIVMGSGGTLVVRAEDSMISKKLHYFCFSSTVFTIHQFLLQNLASYWYQEERVVPWLPIRPSLEPPFRMSS